jgi:N-acetylneuraminic acid mutarotase
MKKMLLLMAMSGCGLLSFAQPGVWVQKADVGTTQSNAPLTKKDAVGFAIGDKGYVGTGQNALNNITRDFQAYDPATNTWTALAMFGGPSRSGAAGFAIGGKGYIGTGSDSTVTPWGSDFWAYDTATGAWSQVASFGGGGRQYATGFSIGNYGYLGAGNNVYGDQDDFWQYDPVANTWTKKANFGGGPRYSTVGFSINGKGYMGTGNDPDNVQTPTFYSDFWEYDTAADTWTQKADFGGGTRSLAVGFSIGNYGYIGTGNESISNGIVADGQRDLWQYDPTSDTWTQKANMPVGRPPVSP